MNRPSRRVLVLGDSTALGTGSGDRPAGIAQWLSADFPHARVLVRAVAGSRMTDLPTQFPRDSRWFDALLIVGGGLDVLHFTPVRQIAATLRGILATARERSPLVIVANSANLAASTLFHWPLDAVLSRRSLKVAGIFRNVCREFDVSFVNFAQPRECDPFSQNPGRFFGPDGFHPSADAYALCYRMIRARTPLRRALSPA